MPGLNGKDGLDGKDGAPGRDGFGFDDMTVEDFDEHFELRFVQGERVKVFTLKKPTRSLINSYRGIWREGSYQKGDCVTHGGSLHIAHEDTSARPETSPTWQVICKRGGAGRDGKDGRNGERGPQGVPGKDLTQMGLDGTKWR